MGNLIRDNPLPKKHTEKELISIMGNDEDREIYSSLIFSYAYEELKKKGIKTGCVVEVTGETGFSDKKGVKYRFTGLKFIHYMANYGKGPLVTILLIEGEKITGKDESAYHGVMCQWHYYNNLKLV